MPIAATVERNGRGLQLDTYLVGQALRRFIMGEDALIAEKGK